MNKIYSGLFETIELNEIERKYKLNLLAEVNKRYSGPFETTELNEISKISKIIEVRFIGRN